MLAKWQLLLFVVDIFPHTFMGICKLHRGTGYSHLSRVKTLYPAAAPAQCSPIHNVSFTKDFSKGWVFLLSFEESFKFSWNSFPTSNCDTIAYREKKHAIFWKVFKFHLEFISNYLTVIPITPPIPEIMWGKLWFVGS